MRPAVKTALSRGSRAVRGRPPTSRSWVCTEGLPQPRAVRLPGFGGTGSPDCSEAAAQESDFDTVKKPQMWGKQGGQGPAIPGEETVSRAPPLLRPPRTRPSPVGHTRGPSSPALRVGANPALLRPQGRGL